MLYSILKCIYRLFIMRSSWNFKQYLKVYKTISRLFYRSTKLFKLLFYIIILGILSNFWTMFSSITWQFNGTENCHQNVVAAVSAACLIVDEADALSVMLMMLAGPVTHSHRTCWACWYVLWSSVSCTYSRSHPHWCSLLWWLSGEWELCHIVMRWHSPGVYVWVRVTESDSALGSRLES